MKKIIFILIACVVSIVLIWFLNSYLEYRRITPGKSTRSQGIPDSEFSHVWVSTGSMSYIRNSRLFIFTASTDIGDGPLSGPIPFKSFTVCVLGFRIFNTFVMK